MKNKFLDNLDGGWGEVISDTYVDNVDMFIIYYKYVVI